MARQRIRRSAIATGSLGAGIACLEGRVLLSAWGPQTPTFANPTYTSGTLHSDIAPSNQNSQSDSNASLKAAPVAFQVIAVSPSAGDSQGQDGASASPVASPTLLIAVPAIPVFAARGSYTFGTDGNGPSGLTTTSVSPDSTDGMTVFSGHPDHAGMAWTSGDGSGSAFATATIAPLGTDSGTVIVARPLFWGHVGDFLAHMGYGSSNGSPSTTSLDPQTPPAGTLNSSPSTSTSTSNASTTAPQTPQFQAAPPPPSHDSWAHPNYQISNGYGNGQGPQGENAAQSQIGQYSQAQSTSVQQNQSQNEDPPPPVMNPGPNISFRAIVHGELSSAGPSSSHEDRSSASNNASTVVQTSSSGSGMAAGPSVAVAIAIPNQVGLYSQPISQVPLAINGKSLQLLSANTLNMADGGTQYGLSTRTSGLRSTEGDGSQESVVVSPDSISAEETSLVVPVADTDLPHSASDLSLSTMPLDAAAWAAAVDQLLIGFDDLLGTVSESTPDPAYMPWVIGAGLTVAFSEIARRSRTRTSFRMALVNASMVDSLRGRRRR